MLTYNKKSLIDRLIIVSTILFVIYLFLPIYFYSNILNVVGFYDQYIYYKDHLSLSLISFVFLFFTLLTLVYFIKKIDINFLELGRYRRINHILSVASVSIYIVSRIPLIYFKLNNLDIGRDAGLLEIGFLLYNPYLSYIFSLALVTSLIEVVFGNRKNIILLFTFGLIPEVLLGARSNIFRFLFLLSIVIPWSFKRLSYLVIFFSFIGFSRYFFSGYSVSTEYDLVVLFFGDMINIFLGQSLLIGNNIYQACGIDGLHFVRALTPPTMRVDLESIAPDIANYCMNNEGLVGFGGSTVSDLILAPVSVMISAVFLVLILTVVFELKCLNRLMPLIILLIAISSFPYFLRNGYVSSVNHLATMFIWFLIPIFLALRLFYMQKPWKNL